MPLSVIGAGLGRTGTRSLKLALNALGFGPCHHMSEVFPDPEAPGRWLAAAKGEAVDWEAMFQGYRSAVDWPSCAFYRVLADRYPDAKVILTEREPEAWFRSTQATIFDDALHERFPPVFREMIEKVVGEPFGGDLHDHDNVIGVYLRHNEEVRRVIPAHRLLVLDPAQGWDPLCAFLGVKVPADPFPHINSTRAFQDGSAQQDL